MNDGRRPELVSASKCELRHDKERAVDLGEREIDLARIVGEYAHPEDAIDQMSSVGFGVAGCYSQ